MTISSPLRDVVLPDCEHERRLVVLVRLVGDGQAAHAAAIAAAI